MELTKGVDTGANASSATVRCAMTFTDVSNLSFTLSSPLAFACAFSDFASAFNELSRSVLRLVAVSGGGSAQNFDLLTPSVTTITVRRSAANDTVDAAPPMLFSATGRLIMPPTVEAQPVRNQARTSPAVNLCMRFPPRKIRSLDASPFKQARYAAANHCTESGL